MGEAYRGLTIRFAADGTRVMSVLNAMDRAAKDVGSELRLVNRALKFDSANSTAASERMKLLAEKAALAGAKVQLMRREMAELGKVEFGGAKMAELSASTRDASTQAALAQARYNKVTESLAKLHNEAMAAWSASKQLGNVPNPFIGWKDLPANRIAELITYMEKAGAITSAEAARMRGAVMTLRPAFSSATSELKKFTSIAQYQSFGHKLEEESAKVKAAAREMAAAAKEMRASDFTAGLKDARAEVDRLGAEVTKLNQAMRMDPKSLKVYGEYADAARAKMQALSVENDKLQAEMRSLGAEAGVKEAAADMTALVTKTAAARAEVDRLSVPFAEAKAKAAAMRQEVQLLEISLANAGGKGTSEGFKISAELDEARAKLKALDAEVDNLTPSMRRAEETAQLLNKAMRFNEARAGIAANDAAVTKLNASLNTAKKSALVSSSAFTSMGMQLYATLYPAVMMGGHYAVTAAEEVDSAYRDMRKTVQGTEEDFENLKQKALEFGDTHFTSADTMLEIESYGGQLGIAVENLEAFGKVVSDLDIATNDLFQTEDIALWLGKMANIMHLNVEEYDNFADALVRLGNSEPALESDIAAITARFAGMATIVGMAPDQILAIATAATATGQKAEAAGGSLQRTFGRIEGAVAGVSEGMRNLEDITEEDIEAFESAKDSLQGYADIAGMTSEAFAELWETDATGAFQKFVEGLKAIDENGGSVDKTLQDLGITSVRDRQLLEGLTNTTTVLAESLQMSNDAFNGISDQWGDAGDAAREADNKSQGFSGTLQIMKNNAEHLAMAVGDSLTPVLKGVTELLSGLVDWFTKLSPEMQTFLSTSLLLSAGLGPTLTGIGAFGNMVNSFRTSMDKATTAEQTMLRMNNTAIPGMSKLRAQYVAMNSELEKSKSRLTSYEKGLKNAESAYKSGKITASQYATAQASIGTMAGKAEANVGKMTKSMTKLSKASMVVSGISSFAKGMGSMLAVGAAFSVIDIAVDKISDMIAKAETYKQATDGMREAAERVGRVHEEMAGKVSSVGSKLSESSVDIQKYREETEAAAEKGAAFTKAVNEKLDGMEENALLADYWAEQMIELSDTFDGTPESLEKLKTAVEQYNSVTGSNISIIDEYTGALSANTAEIRANTEAYKEAMMAKAFGEVAQDAAKGMAEATVAAQKYDKQIGKLADQIDDYAESHENAWATDSEGKFLDENMQKLADEASEVQHLRDEQLELKDSYRETRDAALEEMEASQENAEKLKKEAEATEKVANSAEAYAARLEGGADALEAIKAQTGFAEESIDDFAAALNEAGIKADTLGKAGADAFLELYEAADGNLNAVKDGLNLVNDFGIDPKHLIVTDDGTIKVNEAELTDLEKQNISDKNYVVTDDGTIKTAEEAVEGLDAEEVNDKLFSVVADANDAIWAVSNIKSMLDNLHDKTINVTANVSSALSGFFGLAHGGLTPRITQNIPTHADGGINGIVTRATLTNIGYVGEAGNEYVHDFGGGSAIVPIQNSRYVRPLAQSIAHEMGSFGQQQAGDVYEYHITVNASGDGDDIARAVTKAIKAQNLMKGRR